MYFEADRLSATRFCYLYALVTPGYATPQLVDETLEELRADPPQSIVDVGSPALGEPGFQELLLPRPIASDGRDLDLLDPCGPSWPKLRRAHGRRRLGDLRAARL